MLSASLAVVSVIGGSVAFCAPHTSCERAGREKPKELAAISGCGLHGGHFILKDDRTTRVLFEKRAV